MSALTRWWLGVPLAAPMSGYFALTRRVFDDMRLRLWPRGYKILQIVRRAGPIQIVELPYVLKDRRQGVSKPSAKVAIEFLASL